MVIHDAEADKKYVKQPVALDGGIEAFVAAYQAGELKPLIKSEAVPADNSGPVKVLVADNWEAMVQAGKTYMLARARAWPGLGWVFLVPVHSCGGGRLLSQPGPEAACARAAGVLRAVVRALQDAGAHLRQGAQPARLHARLQGSDARGSYARRG